MKSNILLTFGINGSLRKREVTSPDNYTEYYLFNSAANMKAYSYDKTDFAYYGYNASNTRTYKLNFLNANSWVNGQQQSLQLNLQQGMFYPNAYLTFNQNGNYTKHYYNGSERIASRLGSNTHPTDATSNDRLEYRMMRSEEKFRENIQELVSDGQPVDFQGTVNLNSLQPVNATSDIFYYHTNHLGSTAFVTDNNATVTQGFLYAPFGEITTEYTPMWQNSIIPKYSFNAKELDEETGMYYYEARYYNPPVFVSRDAMFEKYFWMSPYAYCANNPMKYVDPTGYEFDPTQDANHIKPLQNALEAEREKRLSERNKYAEGTSENSKERGGSTSNRIRINPEQVVDVNRTLSHEIGHTLGIPDLKNMIKDDNGLMVSGGNGMEINSEYIQHMFSKFHFGNISSPSVYYMQDAKTHNSRWDGIFESDFKKDMQHGRVIK